MATDTQKPSDEQQDETTAAGTANGPEGGCAKSMAEHLARAGGMKAMADAVAKCCGGFAGPGSQSPAGTEADEAQADTEASSSCTKEASR
jgi:hypothetical protein